MGFFRNIFESVKRKQEEIKDRKEFLDMVETKAKPIRRTAYMKEMLVHAIQEGKDKARADALLKENKIKKKEPSDFGLKEGLADPYKFLDPSKTKLTNNKK
jgi:hypothetical protein